MNDCGGPRPIQMFRRALEKINSTPNYQYELFSVLEEDRWVPMEDRIEHSVFYHMYPYDYIVNYISSWEMKNALA
jgi:hypothetical protein